MHCASCTSVPGDGQDLTLRVIPWAPQYAVASDRTVWSCKRRGPRSNRVPNESYWRQIKTAKRRKGRFLWVAIWHEDRTIWFRVEDLYQELFT